ncbi:putative transmembrane protein [Rhizobium leguminosarum bv. trifolii WSM2304]|uniref:Transmembrane protein n=1 Tax=Rhizobium leguminosarum bv. trifolii (strain WSM2304) TaxID=395492 RepID=A0ABF7QTG3_RHILW|nr:hypothetical protein [Rhizobium leguminosarum]ACI57502.1 putative transmembrane protein [Rhizobium leguminosarum bv. trifolii WSM2304]
MKRELIPLWIGLCVEGSLCAYSWYWYIRSIIFYRKNGFDFSEAFGFDYFPSFANEPFLATPKAKFVALHFVLAMTSVLTISTVLSLMGIIKACMDCADYGLPM